MSYNHPWWLKYFPEISCTPGKIFSGFFLPKNFHGIIFTGRRSFFIWRWLLHYALELRPQANKTLDPRRFPCSSIVPDPPSRRKTDQSHCRKDVREPGRCQDNGVQALRWHSQTHRCMRWYRPITLLRRMRQSFRHSTGQFLRLRACLSGITKKHDAYNVLVSRNTTILSPTYQKD